MGNVSEQLIRMLRCEAIAQRAKALLTLKLLFTVSLKGNITKDLMI